MKLPLKTLERNLLKAGYDAVLGVDEVGMGCLAGPVVVCAVMLTPDFYKKHHRKLAGLRDSKLLSAKQREKYSSILKNIGIVHTVTTESSKTIDRINIYRASRLAMRKAVNKLKSKNENLKTIVLVDGNKKIEGLDYDQRAIVKGDRKIFAIACASVIAKVYRDALMVRMAKKYPGYGFEIHKGYGTVLHRRKIKELGPTPLHRRSFKVK